MIWQFFKPKCIRALVIAIFDNIFTRDESMTSNSFPKECPLCDCQATQVEDIRCPEGGPAANYDCARCGRFAISGPASQELISHSDKYRLCGVTRNHWDLTKERLWIREANLESLKNTTPKATDVSEKIAILLRWICQQSTSPGHWVDIVLNLQYPVCFSADVEELHKYVRFLEGKCLIAIDVIPNSGNDTYRCNPTIDGWVESQRIPNAESNKVFVAMWFDPTVKSLFDDAIRPAIEEDCHYKAMRIDRKESNGKIDDEIVAEIRESRFVIADFTGQRGGVYFEAGFAQGMGLPVVWLCRDDDLKNVHFDTRQFNHLVWKSDELPDIRKRLADRIRATIGMGNSPPAGWHT